MREIGRGNRTEAIRHLVHVCFWDTRGGGGVEASTWRSTPAMVENPM